MGSIIMMFGAFTSAYLVRQAAGNWLEYQVPTIFYYSTGILLVSSLLIELSYRAFKAGSESRYKLLLIGSFILGVVFVVMQYFGWLALYGNGITLDGNPSGAFFYVISGVHALHVLGGVSAMTVAMLHGFGLKFDVTPKRVNRFSLVVQYWHFVDVLWLYLFIFILFTH